MEAVTSEGASGGGYSEGASGGGYSEGASGGGYSEGASGGGYSEGAGGGGYSEGRIFVFCSKRVSRTFKKIRVTKRASGLYLGLEEKDERLHWSGH